jgi:hypothetical protein
MKKIMVRSLLVIAVSLVLLLACYGLARAYLAYEAGRTGRMLRELEAVKIGDSEAQVLPMLQRYGHCQKLLVPWTTFDKTDYEYLVDIGPSGIYYLVDRASTGAFYRTTRAVFGSLNPRLRRAIGLRRWNVYGRVGFKENRVATAFSAVIVEGSHEWLGADWSLVETIPESEIDTFVTIPGVSWPHGNRYLVGWWGDLTVMETNNGGGEAAGSWITPSATEDEKRSAHEFGLQCLTSRSGCRTVCGLYPAAGEYFSSGRWKERTESCTFSSGNSYW